VDEEIRDREFLGQGWAFPLQFNPRGQIALAAGERDIVRAIQLILSTMPGERVMRPEFGCQAWDLVYSPIDAETISMMSNYVTDALNRWEPRIDVDGVESFSDPEDDGRLLVEIRYTIKATHDPRSIVYPFFIVDEAGAA
jgi:phage baseplate assembly protein W